ncbi:hypothetical protein AB5J49_35515 [Streptomyces sp. R28]|uniref:Uncharacterized protein n=1 Tax=Streptomyces sp. R28 TaxID=3238628 RepID=A0AB39Q4P6_9ACTN
MLELPEELRWATAHSLALFVWRNGTAKDAQASRPPMRRKSTYHETGGANQRWRITPTSYTTHEVGR